MNASFKDQFLSFDINYQDYKVRTFYAKDETFLGIYFLILVYIDICHIMS